MSKITYTPEPPITYTPGLIGCVQHDCAECRETAEEMHHLAAETATLKDHLADAEEIIQRMMKEKAELLEALKGASNYIDTLGGVSQSYRQKIDKNGGQA